MCMHALIQQQAIAGVITLAMEGLHLFSVLEVSIAQLHKMFYSR